MLEELKDRLEEAARKREELIKALREGRVRDPFSSTIIATLIISAALSAATAALNYFITPRQRFTQGDRGGQEFQIQRSAQGTPIPEIFGADPGDGLGGGIKVAPIIAWLSRDAQGNVARKHTQTSRGGGGGKAPKAPETTTVTYDLDALLMWARGPLTLRKLWAATDIIYRQYNNGVDYYQAENGTLAGGATVVSDGLASGGQAVSIPQNGSVQFNGVLGDGTPVVLEFYLKSTIENSVEMNFVGDPFNDTIGNTGGVYALGEQSLPFVLPAGSGNSIKIKNLSSTAFTLDRLGVRTSGGATGVPVSGIPVDDGYDADSPHAPLIPYERPTERFSGELLDDGNGGRVGIIQAGSYAGIANYEGNGTELPDSVVESAVDALYGEGSTPAYRRYATTRLSNFYLTKYQEIFPPMQGLLEHTTIKTLEDIFSHLCERVGLTSDDYDFSDLASIDVRGVVVSPPYTPKELMTTLARLFGCYFYESDKIYGLRYSSAPTFSLSDSDLGWVDEDSGDESVLPELGGAVPVETEIPRRVTVKYIDPERNYAENSQNEPRQITTGQREEIFEVMVTMTASEAREASQRELYREDVEATTHNFSLSYEHMYRNPGDVATITRAEGFTHQVRITSIKPAIGAIECEGVAIDTAAYTQPVDTGSGGFETPPVRIPGQTLAGFYDGPLLRDEENTINNGLGFHAWAAKRYGDGDFTGSALYVDRGLGYELIAQFTKQAVYGVTASVLTDETSVHEVVADALTVDLHNPDDIIESNTRADLLAGAGACIIGTEVGQILDAVREPDTATYPNRWYLTIGLRARRGTDYFVDSHVSGERFVLINDAIQFVPLNVNEQNVTRNYKMVSSGQSLDDAAIVAFTFTAGGAMKLAPVNPHRHDNSQGDSLVEFSPRESLGHGLHSGLSGFGFREVRKFEVELTDSSFVPLSPSLTFFVSTDEPQKAVIESFGTDGSWVSKFTGVTVNSFTLSGLVAVRTFRSLQAIRQTNNFVEATLTATPDAGATLGLMNTLKDWKTDTPDYRILLSAGGAGASLEIYDGATVIYSEDAAAYYSTGVRVRMELRGSRVLFFKGPSGDGSQPLAESVIAPEFPFIVAGSLDVGSAGSATIADVMLSTYPDPKAVITQAQKTEYGVGSTLYANIYELDPRTGRGYPLQVALVAE